MSTSASLVNQQIGALEQGLGVQRTKLGPGNKTEGYAMPKSSAKAFVGGICATLIVLTILVVVYAGMANDERVKSFLNTANFQKKLGQQKVETVRLGMALHQQETKREDQESDTRRAFSRIQSVVNKKFDSVLAESMFGQNDQQDKLKELKDQIASFVEHELKDWDKTADQLDAKNKERLEKLMRFQEQSLRDLLSNVSGIKMDAIEDMLKEIFESSKQAHDLRADESVIEEIEQLADKIYEEEFNLEQGRSQWEKLRPKVKGELPEEMMKAFSSTQDSDTFAETLEDLIDNIKLSAGREEIAKIESKWKVDIEKASKEMSELDQANDDKNDDEDDDDDDFVDLEIKVNVDTVLSLHKLMAEGKIPIHLLDFDSLDIWEDDDGTEDEVIYLDEKTRKENQENQEKQGSEGGSA